MVTLLIKKLIPLLLLQLPIKKNILERQKIGWPQLSSLGQG